MKTILLLSLLLLPVIANSQTITTYAGNGILGYSGDGGLATSAKIATPGGLGFDNNGNLLICHANLVRKVNASTGIITTIAGSDTATTSGGGGDGGVATCALLISPADVCVDKVGNYYIADNWYGEVRKVSVLTGIIDTFAGCRSVGSTGDGGLAKYAKFNGVVSLCIDTNLEVLYVADEFNHKIRKINMLTGIITTCVGTGTNGFSGDNGPATNADLSRVLSICLDHFGNLYIGDWDNARIRKVDVSTNLITTFAGNGTPGFSGDGGPATSASIFRPQGLCFDSCGNMYISDVTNDRVRRIDVNTNIITTIAGNGIVGYLGDGGPATAAEFDRSLGIEIDKYGNVYIADANNHRVRKVTPDTSSCYQVNPSLNVNKIDLANVNIFPNPVTTELTITSANKITGVSIINFIGKVVFVQEYNTANLHIDIASLPAGLYSIKVMDSEGRKTITKMVKQ